MTLSWLTAAQSAASDTDAGGWNGYTIRQIIDTSEISNTGLAFIRVSISAASGEAYTFSNMYVGHAAAAGDVYDFESTPTEVLFSGGSGSALSSGQTKVSDQTTFQVSASKNLIVSFYGASANDGVAARGTETGWSAYWKNANDAATVNATGYALSGNDVLGIFLVEVAASEAFASQVLFFS